MFDLSEQISEFIINCKCRKALNNKTLQAYSTDLAQFYQFTNGSYSKESICEYLSSLHDTFKPKTVKRKIATLKAFSHFFLIEDIIDTNPFQKIETTFREPIILSKTIPLNVITNILAAAYSQLSLSTTIYKNRLTLRDIAVLEMLFATGARVSEICSLSPTSVDLDNHTIKIYGKGSKERMIQIENGDVLNALKILQYI